MFLFQHFFADLECSINNLSDILRTDADTHEIYENHKIDKLKESNPKHYNDGEVGKWENELYPEQDSRIKLKYIDFYEKFPSLT